MKDFFIKLKEKFVSSLVHGGKVGLYIFISDMVVGITAVIASLPITTFTVACAGIFNIIAAVIMDLIKKWKS